MKKLSYITTVSSVLLWGLSVVNIFGCSGGDIIPRDISSINFSNPTEIAKLYVEASSVMDTQLLTTLSVYPKATISPTTQKQVLFGKTAVSEVQATDAAIDDIALIDSMFIGSIVIPEFDRSDLLLMSVTSYEVKDESMQLESKVILAEIKENEWKVLPIEMLEPLNGT
jgi:hypothetical protein